MLSAGGLATGRIFLLFSEVYLGLLLSLLSWPLISTSTGRCPFCFLLCQPKGLASCAGSFFMFVILGVGGPVPFPSFLTLLLRPRILLCLILISRSSLSHPWKVLWTAAEMNPCSVPSELFVSFPDGAVSFRYRGSLHVHWCEEEDGVLKHHLFLT